MERRQWREDSRERGRSREGNVERTVERGQWREDSGGEGEERGWFREDGGERAM